MRKFKSKQEAEEYIFKCKPTGRYTFFYNTITDTHDVSIDNVEEFIRLVGKEILCKVGLETDKIFHTKVNAVSPNEQYVHLYSGLVIHDNIGWRKISDVTILDVLDSNG